MILFLTLITVYVAVDGTFAGILLIADEIKPDTLSAIHALRTLGIKKQGLLT